MDRKQMWDQARSPAPVPRHGQEEIAGARQGGRPTRTHLTRMAAKGIGLAAIRGKSRSFIAGRGNSWQIVASRGELPQIED
jgi:hypothetical protein